MPLIISVLERDKESFDKGPFKLKGPYLKLIDGAIGSVQSEQKETNIYLRRNQMKVIKGKNDGSFTDYTFFHNGREDKRRYLNIRLRNRTEELISIYFEKGLQAND